MNTIGKIRTKTRVCDIVSVRRKFPCRPLSFYILKYKCTERGRRHTLGIICPRELDGYLVQGESEETADDI